jgi:hypothetical protein
MGMHFHEQGEDVQVGKIKLLCPES